ncbi:MAG: hypothetical protein HZA79_12510 [Sphingobacteriales bacterium]|nr:hypothetical protein [Sphingobacteriales bacterium]
MSKSMRKQKAAAWILLLVFSVQTFYPVRAYALTSGPTTPEMSAFEPASTANMVDLFSGDFSYNIPLLDVGGYPVNLAYHSGAGPEEEASWVGLGWSLNPGAINRQLRGLPDDFNGDVITQEDNKKPNITVGGNVNASIKLFGNRTPKIKIGKKKKNLNGNMKVKIGILHNNYTGYKGIIGIGTGFSTSDQNSDAMTKNLSVSADPSTSLGLSVDNQSGVNPYANFEVNYKVTTKKEREAARNLTISQQENLSKTLINAIFHSSIYDLKESASKVAKMERILNRANDVSSMLGGSSSINFGTFQPPALVQTPMVSKNFTASLGIGVTLFGVAVVPGIEGTYSRQELKQKINTAPAYGFMNGHIAKSKDEAILDYNMEKESPYFKRLPNLGVTVFTPDLFNVTSNAGSMQFRPYLRGTGIYFQPHKLDEDKSTDIGLEAGFGNIFHLGVPLQLQKTNNISGKWTAKNNYLSIGDFKSTGSTPDNQAFYFKRVGEKNRQDDAYFGAIGNTSPVAVRLDNGFSAWAFGKGQANNAIRVKNAGDISGIQQGRTVRDKANHSISYLTAAEAANYALDKQIPNYRENTLLTTAGDVKNLVTRTADYRKAHHISQYTITQDDGQRMVYGIPVYNTAQEEVSFAIRYNATALEKGITSYNPGTDNSQNNMNGKDNYYHKYSTPAYTTGHLLSAILSPDYVDLTNNGVTDDDLGTAVKFNYSQLSDVNGNPLYYKWRTPYSNEYGNNNTANYSEGYRSITDDDKANYTWGKKELWYVHSIESKTMVAQFYTEDRKDGLGVLDENGGKDPSIRLKRLKEIRLYSKSDLYLNGNNAVPVKTVHFEYDETYPLVSQLPNNEFSHLGYGKLTLKRIWFSYGKNTKGQYNSYNFKYKIPLNQVYQDMQSDRWGSYRPKSANPNGLTNLEFPYATQNRTDADDFASYWQLNEIELPSGGIIQVQYESDDYAYVQDRRAAQMCFITGIGSNGGTTGFANADKIYVKLPVATSNADLKKRYFEGLKSLAYKAFIDLDGKGHSEYVSGFADISGYTIANPATGSDIVEITVGKINNYNPIAKAAWQKLKMDLPRYAYAEYDNLNADEMGFVKAIKALGATFSRFKDLVENFDQRAKRKGFGNHINLSKSWVRLCTPAGINGSVKGKLGGGHRVREVKINDQWALMSGVATAETGVYGQRYEYTTEVSGPGGVTEIISSGVASYEPATGSDENPFREPINYSDKHLFGLPKYFYLERPMGESYFPSASVGYSKVTIKNLGADGSVGANGVTVNEFYTSKDFPVKVDDLPMERKQPKISFLPRLFGAKITAAVTVSQGYLVENNDMNGKPKGEAVYGKNGNEISSAKYYYKVSNPGAEKQELNNNVSVIDRGGTITPNAIVGMDIDMFTEMNESLMENMGVAVDPSFGVTIYGIIPKFSIKLPLPKPNYEKRLYRGSSTIKLVNRYAILEKSVKTVNGSTSVAENLLWDAETGEVLLSKVNNEFNDNTYTFNYPAHWVYDRMGAAFRNEGVYLAGFTTSSTGNIVTTYNGLLVPGDELIDLGSNNQYWVTDPHKNGQLYLVDKDGAYKPGLSANVKISRSGRRNLAMASVGSVVTMNNPINGASLNFTQASNVLQAGAVNYADDWKVPLQERCAVDSACWSLNQNSNTATPVLNFVTPALKATSSLYSFYGTKIYNPGYNASGDGVYQTLTTPYWKGDNTCLAGPMNRCAFWVNTNLAAPLGAAKATSGKDSVPGMNVPGANAVPNCIPRTGTFGRWLGYTFNYSTSTPRTIYVGIASDNRFQFKINGTPVLIRSTDVETDFQYWHIYPVCLNPGKYTLEFLGYNRNDLVGEGAFGAEVYDNTLAQLQAATADNSLNIVYSTRNVIGQNIEVGDGIGYAAPAGYYVFKTPGGLFTANQINSVAPAGGAGVNNYFNPYRTGILGNWRVKKQLLYDTKRVNNKGDVNDPTGTQLRNSGYFADYSNYWSWTGTNWVENAGNPRWQWTSQVTKFNRKGQEIENMDALNRFSSAQHGYLESLPVAVAGNAMYREIAFDGFEDYNFNLGLPFISDSCGIQEHFNFRKSLGTVALLDNTKSHSGKYSLKLTGTAIIQKPLLLNEPDAIYGIDVHNQYIVTNGYLRFGFQPVPSRKYIISGWVNDGQPKSAAINGLSLTINGTGYNVNDNAANPSVYSKIHVVEGWKRFEVVFTMPAGGNFTLALGGSNLNVDDIRVHPYDAQLKSYAYDATSLRLMAEMDENNFATFYEYDDEGTLIRVKKETEKGISTIKETRSSVKRKIPL